MIPLDHFCLEHLQVNRKLGAMSYRWVFAFVPDEPPQGLGCSVPFGPPMAGPKGGSFPTGSGSPLCTGGKGSPCDAGLAPMPMGVHGPCGIIQPVGSVPPMGVANAGPPMSPVLGSVPVVGPPMNPCGPPGPTPMCRKEPDLSTPRPPSGPPPERVVPEMVHRPPKVLAPSPAFTKNEPEPENMENNSPILLDDDGDYDESEEVPKVSCSHRGYPRAKTMPRPETPDSDGSHWETKSKKRTYETEEWSRETYMPGWRHGRSFASYGHDGYNDYGNGGNSYKKHCDWDD